jgi:hypothetical protein
MANWPNNRNKHWTSQDARDLRQMAKENTPTRVMGLKLGRTPEAVQSKASELGVSLKPSNQRPYGRKR